MGQTRIEEAVARIWETLLEEARPYFRETKKIFDRIAGAGIPNVQMRTLSMGMSNSYEVAIEEGANLVRIGTKLFGPRIT